jgi:hypothetical protein
MVARRRSTDCDLRPQSRRRDHVGEERTFLQCVFSWATLPRQKGKKHKETCHTRRRAMRQHMMLRKMLFATTPAIVVLGFMTIGAMAGLLIGRTTNSRAGSGILPRGAVGTSCAAKPCPPSALTVLQAMFTSQAIFTCPRRESWTRPATCRPAHARMTCATSSRREIRPAMQRISRCSCDVREHRRPGATPC